MFDAYCPDHGRRVLLPARHIVRLERDAGGTTAHLRCWCGALAVWRSGHRLGTTERIREHVATA
jgi:hypothetical protein